MYSDKKVLIVDDLQLSKTMLSKILVDGGFQADNITHVDGGQAALDIIKKKIESQDQFDLIFLDLNMPDMDGLEVLEILNKDEQIDLASKIIVFSAESDNSVKVKAFGLGAHAYLNKPPSKEAVFARIEG